MTDQNSSRQGVKAARKRGKKNVIITAASIAVAAIVGTAVVVVNQSGLEAAPAATPAPAAPVTPKLSPPDTVQVSASFAEWTPGAGLEGGIAAESGRALDQDIDLSLSGTAPVEPFLSQEVKVKPGTSYELSVSARPGSGTGTLSLVVGSASPQPLTMSPDGDGWQETSWEYTAAPDEHAITLALVGTGELRNARIDAVSMLAAGTTTNLVGNGSFEEYIAPHQITNDTLIMQAGTAYVGVSAAVPSFDWAVTDHDNKAVANGTTETAAGLGLVQLGDLAQGFYSIELTSAAGALPRDAFNFLVLDQVDGITREDRFAVGTHLDRPYYAGSETVAAQLGIAHARTDSVWSRAELEKGSYSWPAGLQEVMDAYKAAEVTVLPISDYGNKLYDGGQTPHTPDGIAAYAKYTSELVNHYGTDSVEVWNEFNHAQFNKGGCGMTAACYMSLLVPTVEKVHADNPGTIIVGPANARKDDKFLTDLYALGGLEYLDAVSFHPYEYDYDKNKGAEFLIDSLAQANDRIREYNNGETKPIWLTEMGWSSTLVENDEQQADYLVRSEVISFAAGVERFYWYDLVNDHLNPADHQGSYGLVRQKTEALPTFEPKASAAAQAVLIRKIAGKTFAESDELDATTYSYAFGTGKKTTRVVWSTVPTSVSFAASGPVTMTDLYGKVTTLKPTDGIITVDVGESSIYLDGALTEATVVG